MVWTRLVHRKSGWTWRAALFTALAVLSGIVAFPSEVSAGEPAESVATGSVLFEGQAIDLSEGWGDAEACLIWNDIDASECFRDEASMDKRIAELENMTGTGTVIPMATPTCSGDLRLYDGYYHTGQVLYMRDRLQWINLSVYGFSNRMSSFKIGPCSSYLADYNWGGGSWYSTSATQAFDVAYVAASGWNNRVSSVYIQ